MPDNKVIHVMTAEIEPAAIRAREIPKRKLDHFPITCQFIQKGDNNVQVGYVENFFAGRNDDE